MNTSTLGGSFLGVVVGLAAGLGAYTFVYARAASYLTDDPAACANCHVMRDHFNRWLASSHRWVAVCNDCHTPRGLVAQYATKAANGVRHSVAFTLGRVPDQIRIAPGNRAVAEAACRKCHADVVAAMEGPPGAAPGPGGCVRCHESVGHLH